MNVYYTAPQTEPNKERIAEFVAALRSGKYRQGIKALRRISHGKETFCCLGVACEVAIANGLDLDVVAPPSNVTFGDFQYDTVTGYLPRKVRDWYGLADNPRLMASPPPRKFVWWRLFWQPKSTYVGPWVTATRANDEIGLSFREIADAFERTYLQ